jgi:hypothetical protein
MNGDEQKDRWWAARDGTEDPIISIHRGSS